MKTVTLFRVTSEEVVVANHLEHLEHFQHLPEEEFDYVRGAEDYEVVIGKGIKKYVSAIRCHRRRTNLSPEYLALTGTHPLSDEAFSTDETYIAIDPAAERVLDLEYRRMKSLSDDLDLTTRLNRDLRSQRDGLYKVIGTIKIAGFFTRIKWVFTGVR